MEMEDSNNQPKIAPKPTELQEMTKKGEEDRISALPDCLIVEILSRLPCTEDAIRTGILSKRWKPLWTLVHTLNFKYFDDIPILCPPNPKSRSDFFSFVDNTLSQCRQLKLKKIEVYTSYHSQFQSQVNDWISYVISCNIEELEMVLWPNTGPKFSFDQSFFTNTCLKELGLGNCILNPIGTISWKKLRSLCISHGKLDEDLIENILSGSPLLETFRLVKCYGYRQLNITSKSVKSLVLDGYMNHVDDNDDDDVDDIIKINAPNILSLTVKGRLWLSKLLLVNVSSLVEANLDYCKGWYEETTDKDMHNGFILSLRHVKHLNIGSYDFRALSRLEEKGRSDSDESGDSDSVESEDL